MTKMMKMNQSVKLNEVELAFGLTVSDLVCALEHGIYYYSFLEQKLLHYHVRGLVLTGVDVIHSTNYVGSQDFVAAYAGYKKVWWVYKKDIPKEILEK